MTDSKFDPRDPLGRRTLYGILSTGSGRAHPKRLAVAAGVGSVAALAILLVAPRLWTVAMPFVSLAAFGAWGLTAQRCHDLDLRHESAPLLRRSLRVTQNVLLIAAVLAAVVAVGAFLSAVLSPDWSL